MREILAFLALIALGILVYWPGLHGGFLLDDFSNLPILADVGGVRDWHSLLRYLAADISGELGRPVSRLSFLLNYQHWPTPPWPFKVTNLVLHLLTGGLLYGLVRSLLPGKDRQAHWIALAVAGFWLLNPMNVATVLYVIQRMAILATLFTLLGLWLYVHGRRLFQDNPRKGYVWMTVAILACTPLAVLSKENGALLPLLALVLEYTVLRHHLQLPAPDRRWSAVFLWLPAIVVLAALFHFSTPAAYASRDFTLAERLLTESRVLFDYAWHWLNPVIPPRGVLADGYPLSKGLLEPWTTLPAVLGILGALAWAIWQRRRHPLAALAILFFLAGHAMESTVVPLEIYFEHRNYLPAVFLALPPAAWLLRQPQRYRLLPALLGLVLLGTAFQSYRLAMVWANDLTLALWSAKVNPDSSRAQDFLATALAGAGRPDLAVVALEKAIRYKPEQSHYYLHLLAEKCQVQEITIADWQRLRAQFRRYPLDLKSLPLLGALVDLAPNPDCRGVSVADLLDLQDELVNHPQTRANPETLRQFLHLQGVLRIKAGQPDLALQSFAQAQSIKADIGMGMLQVAQLGSNGYYRQGLQWLARVAQLPRPQGWRQQTRSWDYDREIDHLRKQLEKDLATKATKHR
jgi:tetratricopeptide (TPR) repeat protein